MIWLLGCIGYVLVAGAGVVWAGYSSERDESSFARTYGNEETEKNYKQLAAIIWPVGIPILLAIHFGMASVEAINKLSMYGRELSQRKQLPRAKVITEE